MKKSLFLLVCLCFPFSATAQNFFPNSFLYAWEGSGTLMGNDASFSMQWAPELNNQFIRLTFENRLNNGSFAMQAHAYYKVLEDGSLSGTWFDSRGITFPVSGEIHGDSIVTYWGSPDIEEGRTEYVLKEPGLLTVTDFVLRNGVFTKFGEATYQQKED